MTQGKFMIKYCKIDIRSRLRVSAQGSQLRNKPTKKQFKWLKIKHIYFVITMHTINLFYNSADIYDINIYTITGNRYFEATNN